MDPRGSSPPFRMNLVEVDGRTHAAMVFQRCNDARFSYLHERSAGLHEWFADLVLHESAIAEGCHRPRQEKWRSPTPFPTQSDGRLFFRVRVSH